MDEHTVSSLPLAAVARHGIAVIEVRILSNVERDRATRVQTGSKVATLVDLLDSAQLTVGDVLVPIRRCELYAVACTERPFCLSVQRHAMQATRIVTHLLAVPAFHCHQILTRIYPFNAHSQAVCQPPQTPNPVFHRGKC